MFAKHKLKMKICLYDYIFIFKRTEKTKFDTDSAKCSGLNKIYSRITLWRVEAELEERKAPWSSVILLKVNVRFIRSEQHDKMKMIIYTSQMQTETLHPRLVVQTWVKQPRMKHLQILTVSKSNMVEFFWLSRTA